MRNDRRGPEGAGHRFLRSPPQAPQRYHRPGGGPSTRDAAQSATSVTSAPTSPPPIDAERRQLTVLFCDLVGSTGLAARLDPEDLRTVIGSYHRCVAGVVERVGGFVAKYMGDGVLAYFGYPRADE